MCCEFVPGTEGSMAAAQKLRSLYGARKEFRRGLFTSIATAMAWMERTING